ncbi:MAG: helicase-exonuclease AddAB subunit AddA [Clostridia bacterium]|nr:helicase-exonuclease AddAB subunit AddA [Clostridia bacterium]
MPEWTLDQQRVIQSNAREIICSAAAGSGKTAVMVERIVRFLKEGVEPDQFLIMTFTNAAASEMKEKIRNRLFQERSNPSVLNALDKLDLMQISTIHAFCQQLIRNQFQMVEIDPNFQICDSSQRQRLFHEAFKDACDQLSENKEASFSFLKQRYDLRQAEDLLHRMDTFLLSLPNPAEWMKQHIENIPSTFDESHPWFSTVYDMAHDALAHLEILLSRMYKMISDVCAIESYKDTWREDAELFHVKQLQIEQRQPVNASVSFARLKTPKGLTPQESDWKDRYQKIRNQFKKEFGELDDLLMVDREKAISEWQNIRESLEALQQLFLKTEELFQQKKKSRALVDFQDLEQYAVQILSDPLGREEAHATWRYIFVDECQDISAVQNHIIDLLQEKENHLFMVGDVKQSIYRFRLADPIIFMERIQKIEAANDPQAECIYLQSNFRSRPEILEATNMVFRSIMKENVTEIRYSRREELVPGRKTTGTEPIIIEKIDKGEQDLSDLEALALYLKQEISALRQTPYSEKGRYYQYRDCVILMPAVQTDGPFLAELLTKLEVPVFFDGSGDYYQLREVQIIRNLLDWIDYPLQDLPLLSVLSEPPFEFTDEELALIRLKHMEKDSSFHEAFHTCLEEESPLGEKCRFVMEKLHHWQNMAETMSVSELIWRLYEETGIYFIIAVDPAGDVKQANLRMLAQQAAQAAKKGIVTLRQFINYMKEQQSFGDQQAATLLGEQDDLVRIMTIHKSKGLQFPVVFCAGMDKSAVRADQREICFHSRLGMCVDYKDPVHRISRPTLATEIFSWKKKREEMAEKVRLLYVAMTRAQEKLYLLTCQDTNPLWSMPEGDGRILGAKSYTDWWMPVFLQADSKILSTSYSQGAKPYEIRVSAINQQQIVEKGSDIHNLTGWLNSIISAPVVDELWKKEEEQEPSPTLPKRSVSSLIRNAQRQLEEEEQEETAEQKRMPDQLAQRLAHTDLPETPDFMKEQGKMTAAWRGTLTHRLLSLMNLDQLKQGVNPAEVLQQQKDYMISHHMVSPAELKVIRDQQILSFWQSTMGQRILQANEVHREWNFNLLIHRDQDMILQGVIDCAFREGEEWVILDYKTDRNKSPDQLREEYTPQLQWYAKAIEELTGQRVKEIALYALALDEIVPLHKA